MSMWPGRIGIGVAAWSVARMQSLLVPSGVLDTFAESNLKLWTIRRSGRYLSVNEWPPTFTVSGQGSAFGQNAYWRLPNSSSGRRSMSRAIFLSRVGEMSRPGWKGTVVPRPSSCRYCRCDPRWRTCTNPSRSRRAATSRGFSTGIEPTPTQLEWSELR